MDLCSMRVNCLARSCSPVLMLTNEVMLEYGLSQNAERAHCNINMITVEYILTFKGFILA
jgi:hypothetical protein